MPSRSVTSPARLAVALRGPSTRTREPERIRHETLLPQCGCPAQRGLGCLGRGAGWGPDARRSALACGPCGVLRGGRPRDCECRQVRASVRRVS